MKKTARLLMANANAIIILRSGTRLIAATSASRLDATTRAICYKAQTFSIIGRNIRHRLRWFCTASLYNDML